MEILKKINIALALPLVLVIWVYQRTLSPDHGLLKFRYPYGYCKFYPSCSEYARQTIMNQGLMGLPKIVSRVARCNALNSGGVDLPKQA